MTTDAELPIPSLLELVGHLERAGWRQTSQDERSTEWVRGRGDLRAVLPRSEQVTDYEAVVRAALRVVAYEEQRPERDVLEDVALGGADVLAFRFTPDALAGEAPLRLAQSVVNAAKNLIVGAASSLEVKSTVLPSRRPARAEAFSGQARVGVEAGSFVFRVALPVGGEWADRSPSPSGEILDEVLRLSYGRAVTTRVQNAVMAALAMSAQVSAGKSGIQIFGLQGQTSVNATELAALGAFGGPDREPYSVRFSRSPLVAGDLTPRVATVTSKDQDVFTEAAEFLRTQQPRSNVTIQGLVVRLKRNSAFGAGEVVIHSTTDDSGKQRNVRVELSEEDYNAALVAHGQGLRIQVSGDLEIRGYSQALIRVNSFQVIGGLDDDE